MLFLDVAKCMIIVMKKLNAPCSWNTLFRTCGNVIEVERFAVRFEVLKFIIISYIVAALSAHFIN